MLNLSTAVFPHRSTVAEKRVESSDQPPELTPGYIIFQCDVGQIS